MNFNKKSLTISLITAGIVFLFTFANVVLNPLFASLAILFVYYFLLYWLLDFDIEPMGFINVILLSGFYVQSLSFFIISALKSSDNTFPFFTYFLIVGLFLLIQVVNRIANITNISLIKKIPLFQVSQSFNYIFSTVSIFLSLLSLELLGLNLLFVSIYSLVIILLATFCLSSLADFRDRKTFTFYSIITGLITYFVFFSTFFLNINSVFRSLIASLVFFSLLGAYFGGVMKGKISVFNIIQVILLISAITISIPFLINII